MKLFMFMDVKLSPILPSLFHKGKEFFTGANRFIRNMFLLLGVAFGGFELVSKPLSAFGVKHEIVCNARGCHNFSLTLCLWCPTLIVQIALTQVPCGLVQIDSVPRTSSREFYLPHAWGLLIRHKRYTKLFTCARGGVVNSCLQNEWSLIADLDRKLSYTYICNEKN